MCLIHLDGQVRDVVVGTEGGGWLVLLECNLEGVAYQGETFDFASAGGKDAALRVQGLRDRFRKRQPLRNVEGAVQPLESEVALAREEHEPADLRGKSSQVRVRFLLREQREGSVHALETLLDASALPRDLRDARRYACRGVSGARSLEELARTLEVPRRVVLSSSEPGHHSRPLVHFRLRDHIIGQPRGALEGALRLRVRT